MKPFECHKIKGTTSQSANLEEVVMIYKVIKTNEIWYMS